jgi:hypothetical protein
MKPGLTVSTYEIQQAGRKIVQQLFNQNLNSSDIGAILSCACATLMVNSPTPSQFREIQEALIESLKLIQPQDGNARA